MRTFRALRRDTAGTALIYVTLTLPVIIGFISLGADAGLLFYYQGRLLNTADAAALAGAAVIPDNDGTLTGTKRGAVVSEAMRFARKNMPPAQHQAVLNGGDVEVGHWDADASHGAARTFYAEGNLPQDAVINAVRVSTKRAQANGNEVSLIFARALGFTEFGLSAGAVATSEPVDKGCLTAGFTALGIAEGGSQNTILDGFCIHGEEGVKFGSQNCMEGGEDADSEVIISMPHPGAGLGNGGHELGSDNEVVSESMCNDGVYSNNDLPDNVEQQSIADFADDDFIFDLDYPAGDSDHVDKVRAKIDDLSGSNPWGLTPIFQDDYVISSDSTVSNQLIISNSKITIGSNVSLNNVYLLAKENVEFGSDVTIGSPDFCNTQTGQVFILAGEQAKFGSDNHMNGR